MLVAVPVVASAAAIKTCPDLAVLEDSVFFDALAAKSPEWKRECSSAQARPTPDAGSLRDVIRPPTELKYEVLGLEGAQVMSCEQGKGFDWALSFLASDASPQSARVLVMLTKYNLGTERNKQLEGVLCQRRREVLAALKKVKHDELRKECVTRLDKAVRASPKYYGGIAPSEFCNEAATIKKALASVNSCR